MTQLKQSASEKESSTENRGFASMDEDKQREIASKGGKAAHESDSGEGRSADHKSKKS